MLWDFTDKYSWLNLWKAKVFSSSNTCLYGEGSRADADLKQQDLEACMYDQEMQRKHGVYFDGFINAFE